MRLLLAGRVLLSYVACAASWSQRARGLLGAPPLPPGHALWLIPCRSIHTCGMRFALDLIFLDREQRVVRVVRRVPPWRLVWGGWRAHSVLELTAGGLPAYTPGRGDRLQVDA